MTTFSASLRPVLLTAAALTASGVSASEKRPAVSEKPHAMMQQLAILAGNWTANTQQSEDGGTTWQDLGRKRVHVDLIHKGMLLVEQPDEASTGGFEMHTVIAFDQYRDVYRQSATDDVWGVMDVYEGKVDAGQLVMTNLKAGTLFPIDEGIWRGFRLTIELAQPSRLMLIEKTDDNGASWQPAFRVEYTKLSDSSGPESAPASSEQAEIEQVLALEKSVALVLGEQGYEAYSALFHPDYENWANGGQILNRRDYLERVKPWYEAGNKALNTTMDSISTEVLGEVALSRYRLREDFNNGTSFVGYFTTIARKHQGRWMLYRTSFSTLYRGDSDQLPDELQLR